MRNIKEVGKSLDTLIKYAHLFEWADFGENGHNSFSNDRYLLSLSPEAYRKEIAEEAYTRAAVMACMDKRSPRYTKLAAKVKKQIPVVRTSHDYICKLVTRILCCVENNAELLSLAEDAQMRRIKDGFATPCETDAATAVTVTTFI